MNAPDEHWLLVKNLWLPIERSLDALGANGEGIREKIDSLDGILDSSLIDQLHYLRMERNALIHKDQPLSDYRRWKTTALAVQKAIRYVLQQDASASLATPTSSILYKYNKLLLILAILALLRCIVGLIESDGPPPMWVIYISIFLYVSVRGDKSRVVRYVKNCFLRF